MNRLQINSTCLSQAVLGALFSTTENLLGIVPYFAQAET